MIEVPAIIAKAQFAAGLPFYGQVNEAALTIQGTKYEARTLRYKGFAGGLDVRDKLYHGVQRFEPLVAPDAVASAFAFNSIPTAEHREAPRHRAPQPQQE